MHSLHGILQSLLLGFRTCRGLHGICLYHIPAAGFWHVQRFAEKKGWTPGERLHMISLGQGQVRVRGVR
jgi:hypothetical protein